MCHGSPLHKKGTIYIVPLAFQIFDSLHNSYQYTVFSHPDFTVGSGILPDLLSRACGLLYRRSGIEVSLAPCLKDLCI